MTRGAPIGWMLAGVTTPDLQAKRLGDSLPLVGKRIVDNFSLPYCLTSTAGGDEAGLAGMWPDEAGQGRFGVSSMQLVDEIVDNGLPGSMRRVSVATLPHHHHHDDCNEAEDGYGRSSEAE
jgi:hypothetical protein